MKRYDDRIIKVLFSKEIKEYIEFKESFTSVILSEEEFLKVYKILYPSHTQTDEIKNRYNYYKEKLKKRGYDFTYLDLLKYFSHEYITSHGKNEIRVRYDEYLNWIGITNKINEDILSTLYISCNKMNVKMHWYRNLKHNDSQINKEILKSKAENHMHLKAGGLNFLFNYYSIMIEESDFYRFKKKVNDFLKRKQSITTKDLNYRELKIEDFLKLKAIRWYFENKSKENMCKLEKILKINSFYELSLSEKEDIFMYHVSMEKFENILDVQKFLEVERKFMVNMFDSILDDFEKYLAYLYVYYKNLFEGMLIERNNFDSFWYFKQFEENKDFFYSDNKTYEYNYLYSLVLMYAEKEKVIKLEYRTPPSDSTKMVLRVRKMERIINEINKHQKVKLEFCSVIHYIKGSKSNEIKDKLRTIANWEKQQLHVKKAMDIEKKIVAIDTANYETILPSEYYAHIIRKHFYGLNKNINKPKLTNHVGEDFITLLTGIRRIAENVEFLPYESGSRIGHSLALNINVENYYKKNNSKIITLDEFLSNYVWLYNNLRKYGYDSQFIIKLESMLKPKIAYLNSKIMNVTIDLENYYASLRLRSDNHEMYKDKGKLPVYANITKISNLNKEVNYNIKEKKYSNYINMNEAKLLNHLFYFDNVYYNTLQETVEDNIQGLKIFHIKKEEFIDSIKFIKEKINLEFSNMGIITEVNLTSNNLITPIEKYAEHDLFDENKKHDLILCTDDPGVFNTSLYREYSIYAKILEVDYNMSKREILERIKDMREKSLDASFIY